ncbi:MAG: protein kinase [Isosphaeraceae bacterium]
MPLDSRRVQAVFQLASECESDEERAAILDRECSGDPDLRKRVEALLAAHDQPDSLFDRPIFGGDDHAAGICRGPAGREDGVMEDQPHRGDAKPGEDTSSPVRALPRIPGYEVLEELDRGGMGVVYRARQVVLNRPCVLKMILAGTYAEPEDIARFLAEAEVVARVQHPNVVQIRHIGEVDGLPFFELELVEAGSLARMLNGTPWPPRRASELVEALSRGVAEAHRLGIIHRDLKPGNVLLTASGVPKVSDFGLAKSLAAGTGITKSHIIMGSPGYMAPELAEGKAKRVGPPADVYGLGAILYELLTGRPPFRGATELETLEQARTADAVPPSRLVPRLPRDVETITMKCLRKDPERRYGSASELADDLGRFREGRPIVAMPISPWERMGRLARRNPTITGLACALILMAGTLGVLGIWSYVRIHDALIIIGAERNNALTATGIANRRAEALVRQDYVNRVHRAYREVSDDNAAVAEDLLLGCPPELRGWEWRYVMRLCRPERLTVESAGESVNSVAFSPDGTWVAAGVGRSVMSADRREIDSAHVGLWDAVTGRLRQSFPSAPGRVMSVVISPDGERVAVGSGGALPRGAVVTIWDVKTGRLIWSVRETAFPAVMSLAYSPDGKTLAAGFGTYSGIGSGRVGLFDSATGHPTRTLPGPAGGVNDLAFHPDGQRIAVAGSGLVEVWDLAFTSPPHPLEGHTRWVYATAYSPDGRWLATTGWDRTIVLWDATTLERRQTIFGHTGFVYDLEFSPDGRTLASAGEDRCVRLWEVPSGQSLARFHGHTDFVQSLAFRRDGREIVTGSLDGTMKYWDMRKSRPVAVDLGNVWVKHLAIHSDGRQVLAMAGMPPFGENVTQGLDLETGDRLTEWDQNGWELLDALPTGFRRGAGLGWPTLRPFKSPDGTYAAERINWVGPDFKSRSGGYILSNSIEVRDAATGKPIHALVGHSAEINCFRFSPDSRRLTSASNDGTIKLWDLVTGQNVFTLRGHAAGVLSLVYTDDGHRLVSGGIEGVVRVWDASPLPEAILREAEARYRSRAGAFDDLKSMRRQSPTHELYSARGQWDVAIPQLRQAVRRKPEDFGLQSRLVVGLRRAGKSQEFLAASEVLLQRFEDTNEPEVAEALACLHAVEGRWGPALNAIRRASGRSEDDPLHWAIQILGLWEGEDVEGARRAASRLLDLHKDSTDPRITIDVVLACALAPGVVDDTQGLIRLARRAADGDEGVNRPDALTALGASLYRAGRFQEAARILEDAIVARNGSTTPRDVAFLTMAHHRLGHRAERQIWLSKLKTFVPKTVHAFTWRNDVEPLILLREAESLAAGRARPGDGPQVRPTRFVPIAPPRLGAASHEDQWDRR